MDGEESAVDAYYRVYDRMIVLDEMLHRDESMVNDLAIIFASAKLWNRTDVDLRYVIGDEG